MNIVLADTNPAICQAWEERLKDMETYELGLPITILNDSFEKAKTDCIVSPANSYAIMDGGIDLAMRNLFGESIEQQIRVETQLKGFAGILPVGAAVAIDLEPNPAGFKHLISAPTMMIPQSIAYTENAYFATLAAITLAMQEDYPSITFVGMGGLTGQLTADVCAKQMFLGLMGRLYFGMNPIRNWNDFSRFHQSMNNLL